MPENSPHIRHRVQLPDGKHVDIVYRHERSAAAEEHGQGPTPSSGQPPTAAGPGGASQPPQHDKPVAPEGPTVRDQRPAARVQPHDGGDPERARESADAGDLCVAPDPPAEREVVCHRAPEPVQEPSDETHPLHVCFNCAGELVYPLDWSEEGQRHWRIVLRCPDCEAYREGVFEQTIVERLDDELDRATSELLGDLKQVTHANMTDEVEFFVRALHADVIVPSDFQR